VGHGTIPAVAGSIALQWSDDALADLNRFAAFLHEQSPELAAIVGEAIIARTQILTRHPKLGRPIAGREEYRRTRRSLSPIESWHTTPHVEVAIIEEHADFRRLGCRLPLSGFRLNEASRYRGTRPVFIVKCAVDDDLALRARVAASCGRTSGGGKACCASAARVHASDSAALGKASRKSATPKVVLRPGLQSHLQHD
jgi:plasmid stabilization system protein ParE